MVTTYLKIQEKSGNSKRAREMPGN